MTTMTTTRFLRPRASGACMHSRLATAVLLGCVAALLSACGPSDKGRSDSSIGAHNHNHADHSHAGHSHAAQPAAQAAQPTQAAQAAANSATPTVSEDGVIVIDSDDRMRFSVSEFTVRPGQTVRLTLRHTGRMPINAMGHNIAILKPYTDVTAFVRAAASAASTQYIPRSMRSQVIAHTKMLGGGQSDTITFTAPEATGDYDFVCSFPAHLQAGMRGVMRVKKP